MILLNLRFLFMKFSRGDFLKASTVIGSAGAKAYIHFPGRFIRKVNIHDFVLSGFFQNSQVFLNLKRFQLGVSLLFRNRN